MVQRIDQPDHPGQQCGDVHEGIPHTQYVPEPGDEPAAPVQVPPPDGLARTLIVDAVALADEHSDTETQVQVRLLAASILLGGPLQP